MALNKKEAWELGFLALAALALFYVFFRNSQKVPAATSDLSGNTSIAPGSDFGTAYWIYNQPQVEGQPVAPNTGVTASQTTGGALPTCGCTGAQAFQDTSAFSQYLQQQLTGIVDKYQENVLSVLPDYFKQFLNVTVQGRSELPAQGFGGF